MSLSISSDASTPSDLATVNCSGFPLAAASTDSEEKVVMNAPFPIELAYQFVVIVVPDAVD